MKLKDFTQALEEFILGISVVALISFMLIGIPVLFVYLLGKLSIAPIIIYFVILVIFFRSWEISRERREEKRHKKSIKAINDAFRKEHKDLDRKIK